MHTARFGNRHIREADIVFAGGDFGIKTVAGNFKRGTLGRKNLESIFQRRIGRENALFTQFGLGNIACRRGQFFEQDTHFGFLSELS
jgi:hypothetical protein